MLEVGVVGMRVKLTGMGESNATPEGVKTWKEHHGLYTPITGTITEIMKNHLGNIYVVKMDGDNFACSEGKGFNTFTKRHVEPVEE
jgi:hypothetical protein